MACPPELISNNETTAVTLRSQRDGEPQNPVSAIRQKYRESVSGFLKRGAPIGWLYCRPDFDGRLLGASRTAEERT
jgi:hypothetical protein